MASTARYTRAELLIRGSLWFDFLASGTADALVAAGLLDARGYGHAGAKKGEPPTEAQRGKALWDDMNATSSGRRQAGTSRSVQAKELEAAENAVRGWTRGLHAEIIGIRREEKSPALLALPTLGDLPTEAGLASSAQALVAFLAVPSVQTALKPYNIGAKELAEGQKLSAAWEAARSKTAGARGGETSAIKGNRAASDAYTAWLNKWWAIASVRMADKPHLLRAMGVTSKRAPRRRAEPVATSAVMPEVQVH
jgi:hypothetical protein